ncbi:MAG TPA: hypothetical protein VN700_07845 [Vicinamibacterales bacterium]|nr:hypothetical protein [Vicinamibacterales bacterium]
MTRLSTTFAAVALAAGMGVQEPTGARSLFYNPATGSTAKAAPSPPRVPATPPASSTGAPRPVAPVPTGTRSVGVHYWIDLTGRGPVADTHSFASGDRIRIHVRTNVDGFLSVWALNTSGRASLLLPVDGDTAGTPVKATQDYVSPLIRFQPPAQDERLLLCFARLRSELPSLDLVEGDEARAAFLARGARNLIVETVEVTAGEVGTYVVNRQGGPIVRPILLRHLGPESRR